MALPIGTVDIYNNGSLTHESVTFKVTEDFNVGHIIVADSTYDSKGKLSNKLRHMYAFPSVELKKGDFVVLWTKGGTNNNQQEPWGRQYNFFWNLRETVWNVGGDAAHFIDVRDVKTYTVGPKR